MKTDLLIFVALASAVLVSCSASTNDTDRAILAFPDISLTNYRPDLAAHSANTLIRAGKADACLALEKLGTPSSDSGLDIKLNTKLCLLCRLLFLPTNSSSQLHPPVLGTPGLLPWNSMPAADWPDIPFAIINNLPLSLTDGYIVGGLPEEAKGYLKYCLANGAFRTNEFAEPTVTFVSNSVMALFASPAWSALKWRDSGTGWSYELSEQNAKRLLLKQVENMLTR